MEYILEDLERIIDDIERDDNIDKDEIIQSLNKIKEEIEDYNLRKEEGSSLEWNDLD